MRTRSRFPLLLLIGLGAVALGVGVVFSLNAPAVESVRPDPDGGRVSALAPVEIVFSQAMNRESVEERLRIDPLLPGRIEWPDDQTLRFVPAAEWPRAAPVTVTLANDGRSARGLPLLRGTTWQFVVDAPRVVYLQVDKVGGASNIWTVLPDGSDAQQLTDEALGVYEFGVSRDGTRVAYAAIRSDGGADLMEIEVDSLTTSELLSCPDGACRRPVYSPDGKWLGFERRQVLDDLVGDSIYAETTVSLLNLQTGNEQALPISADEFTHTPTWVPNGNLAFVNETLRAIGWYELDTGAVNYAPNFAVEMGAWSPDGLWLVYSEILLSEHVQDHGDEPASIGSEGASAGMATSEPSAALSPTPEPTISPEDVFYTHLLRLNVANNQLVELTDIQFVEDTTPVYSPSGQFLAFARKFVEAVNWTPGRQLWVMRADGTEARQLTDDGIYNHSSFVWSPDEQTLVFMRFNVADYNAPPQIWAVDLDGQNLRMLVDGGALPAWLP